MLAHGGATGEIVGGRWRSACRDEAFDQPEVLARDMLH
jgi:hypothetical protein